MTPLFKPFAAILILLIPTQALAQDLTAREFNARMARPPLSIDADVAVLSGGETESCDASTEMGRADATNSHGSQGWFWGTLGATVGFGPYGFAPVFITAAARKPKPKVVPAGQDAACYTDGYSQIAKRKNRRASAFGGLTGGAIAALLMFVAASNGQ